MNNLIKVYIITVLCSFGARCMAYDTVYDLESSFNCQLLESVENTTKDTRLRFKLVPYESKSLDATQVFGKAYSQKSKRLPNSQVILENSNGDIRYKATYTIYGTYSLEIENLETGKVTQKLFSNDASVINVKIDQLDNKNNIILNCFTKHNVESREVF